MRWRVRRARARGASAALLAWLGGAALVVAAPATTDAPPPAAGTSARAPAAGGTAPTAPVATATPAEAPASVGRKASHWLKPEGIAGLTDAAGLARPVGLNEELLVRLAPVAPATSIGSVDARRFALFFNGREVKGLPDPIYNPAKQSLVFELRRNATNKDLWASLLGSPAPLEFTREVTVSLGERPADAREPPQATIVGLTDGADRLQLQELPPLRFGIAVAVIVAVLWLVFARTTTSTVLRDNLLPQIIANRQTYSLARCQMAFWFVLIFCSFLFLYILTWDYNSISPQALALMGISGATALGAVAVDVAKDSPADAVNRGLRALGLNSYEDVVRVTAERDSRLALLATAHQDLAALPPPARSTRPDAGHAQLNQRIQQLQVEVQDRESVLRTYNDRIAPFLTQGWFRDVTTDLNGMAVHRLQVFCWTGVLGAVFLVGVYRNLAMPEFSDTLLALLGLSGAGYVGFKYPEKNS